MWDDFKAENDNIEIEIVKNPPKLTGMKYPKKCLVCSCKLPQSGKGSRKCSTCGEPWKMGKTEVIKTKDGRKEERSLARRVELFKPFMKADVLKPSLDNVDHNHSEITVHVQLPAMVGNPSSLMNIKGHLILWFICLYPKIL